MQPQSNYTYIQLSHNLIGIFSNNNLITTIKGVLNHEKQTKDKSTKNN